MKDLGEALYIFKNLYYYRYKIKNISIISKATNKQICLKKLCPITNVNWRRKKRNRA